MNTIRYSVAPATCVALALSLTACGDDGGSGSGGAGGGSSGATGPSTVATGATSASTSDAASSAGSTSSGGELVCDESGFAVAEAWAVKASENYSYALFSRASPLMEFATIEWFVGLDVGEVELYATNYASCTQCVLIETDCVEADDGITCERAFLSTSGTLTVASATGDLVGALHDVVLVEVTIDEDYVSEVVPGGGTWCLDELAFDLPLEEVDE
jgi:hypothetical protein